MKRIDQTSLRLLEAHLAIQHTKFLVKVKSARMIGILIVCVPDFCGRIVANDMIFMRDPDRSAVPLASGMFGGLYRIDEMVAAVMEASKPKKGQRRTRMNIGAASKWFRAAKPCFRRSRW
ncbi:hypothetical protein [Sulfitobacter sp. HI0054]|uniref:hypothetical protein n=1 Tax=Sulfitobacter sp. HI0054 TaxID=1822238 RepID=UPI0012E7172E|nr:hypothetical protein [Sulfitobacter sp. HI0054]